MKDKELSIGANEKVESIRKKKIERVKTTIQNTKKRMGN
jgi:hypothetical protein